MSVETSRFRRDGVGGEGDRLGAPIGPHHQPELALLGRRQRAERRKLRREIEIEIAARALHRRDHVVERVRGRQVPFHPTTRREQHGIGPQPHPPGEGDEQRRLVLAVAVPGLEHGRGEAGHVAADAERERDVADVLRHPAVHGAERVLERRRPPDDARERRIERRRHDVAIPRQRAVPVRHIRPGERRGDRDELIDPVRIRRERLALDLRHFARRPRVDAAAFPLGGATGEREISLLDPRRQPHRKIHDVARPPGQPARGHAPAHLEIARRQRLQRFDRVAVVEQRARGDAADRNASHPHVGVHRGFARHRGDGLLLVRRLVAQHLAVRPQHPYPVEREALALAHIRERLLAPALRRLPRQHLHHLPKGAAAAAVGFEPDDPVVQQVDEVVVGMLSRAHGQPIDGVAVHAGVAGRRDPRRLGGGGSHA